MHVHHHQHHHRQRHHHHPSSSSAATYDPFFFLAHATRSTLEAWAPNSCSADRACPRRNFAEIIEAKRARGCGALCGHRTGIAGGNLNRACPRHNFSEIMTAKRARGCGAVHGNVLPAQSLGFSLTVESASARVMQWLSLSECTPAGVANCWPVLLVANSAPVSLASAAHDRAAAYGTNTRDVFGQHCPPAEFTTALA